MSGSSNKGLFLTLGTVALVTSAITGTVGFMTYQSWNEMNRTVEQRLQTQDLQGKIIWLDEVLTMSARMTASTGDTAWEDRYNKFVPLLDDAIAKLTELTPVSSDAEEAKVTDEANVKLIDAETKAFELVKAGNPEGAFSLLMGDEYKRNKEVYAGGMDNYNKSVNEFITNKVNTETQKTNVLFIILSISLLVSLSAWAFVIGLIKRWGKGLRDLALSIEEKNDELKGLNEGLEQKVEARTAALHVRNEEMSLILNNTEQGFVMIDREGIIGSERSKVFDTWFPNWKSGEKIQEQVTKQCPELSVMFEMGWEQMAAGFLPVDLAIDQMPSELKVADKSIELSYRPIENAQNELERVLLVTTDVSAKRAQEKLEEESKERMRAFQLILNDKNGFLEFIAETGNLVKKIATFKNESELKRVIHTVKGNSAIYGLQSISNVCHEWEGEFEEHGMSDFSKRADVLNSLWNEKIDGLKDFLGTEKSTAIEIDSEEYASAIDRVRQGLTGKNLEQLLSSWSLESAKSRLSRVRKQAEQLAARLEKDHCKVSVSHNFVRYEGARFSDFWSSLVHITRNAIDHGIDSKADRVANGKPENASLNLETRYDENNGLVVEITDDGNGIDWERVREKAKKNNLPHQNQSDLEAALFSDGFSTRDEATEYSGRGVGLAAVRQSCEALHGRIEIESTKGKGTCFRFTFPASQNNAKKQAA